MLWPRSMAPESDCIPISYVPPSPPNAMNLYSASSLPFFFSARYAVSTPEIVAATFSKALCMNELLHAVYG